MVLHVCLCRFHVQLRLGVYHVLGRSKDGVQQNMNFLSTLVCKSAKIVFQYILLLYFWRVGPELIPKYKNRSPAQPTFCKSLKLKKYSP